MASNKKLMRIFIKMQILVTSAASEAQKSWLDNLSVNFQIFFRSKLVDTRSGKKLNELLRSSSRYYVVGNDMVQRFIDLNPQFIK